MKKLYIIKMDDLMKVVPGISSDSKQLSVLYKTVYTNTYGTNGVTNEFTNFIEKQFSPVKINEDIEVQ